jgi:capsule polysaccharide modification protein KpsS
MIIDRLIELGYDKDIFSDSELEHIIENYQRMKATHHQLRYFTHSLFVIFKSPSLFFDEENDKYVLTTRVFYCDDINKKLQLIIDLFFDFAKDIVIYWGDIAIIDSKYPPIIDTTLIYDEE